MPHATAIQRFLEKNARLLLIAALGLLGARILLHATVAEDAYITFRVIDQFVHGNGLRWNIDERVQVYTHPLWMLLHIPFYFFWENIFLITLGLSLACTAMAVWLPMRTFSQPPLLTFMFFLLPLAASRSFVDYSTSGLENSLMHALFAWVGWILWRARPERFWLWLSLAVGLSLTTRLDTAILYAPLGLYLLATRGNTIRWRQVLAGLSPILAWELFSLFYYGFLFPNTKYAKLNTGADLFIYLGNGINYFLNLVAVDSLSALYLCTAWLVALWIGYRYWKTRDAAQGTVFAFSVGIIFYALYVIYTGGWHTYGRYWTLPVFASIWLVYALIPQIMGLKKLLLFGVMLSLVTALSPSLAQWRQLCERCFRGVWEQPIRNHVSLMKYLRGEQDLPQPNTLHDRSFVIRGQLGQYGYKAAREMIILDNWALCDPLLARLPAVDAYRHRRVIPKGYVLARKTGDLSQMPVYLALYYDKLRLIVSGDLWDSGRLREIITFNLGAYDDMRAHYLEQQVPTDETL